MGLFDSPEQREQSITQFKLLMDSPGWKFYLLFIEEDIQRITKMILTGKDTDDKELTDDELRQRRKDLALYIHFRDAPQQMIESLSETPPVEPSSDPYS